MKAWGVKTLSAVFLISITSVLAKGMKAQLAFCITVLPYIEAQALDGERYERPNRL